MCKQNCCLQMMKCMPVMCMPMACMPHCCCCGTGDDEKDIKEPEPSTLLPNEDDVNDCE